MAVAERHGLAKVPGDVVEIGVLLGGGTYKLCHWFAQHAPDKRVVAIDIFDPTFDLTTCTDGETMAALYEEALAGRDQRSVFDEVTGSCANLTVVAGDSAAVELPCERIAFAYIDGNHSADYVRSDFELVWQRLSPGGVVAFDDYGGNLPEVTRTLHELIGEHAGEIARVSVDAPTLLLERG
jgi:predicted O-methyltransferase YrrM